MVITGKESVKIIRKVLKEAYPDIKFSVKRRDVATWINWTDGPLRKQVMALVSVFEGMQWNAERDCNYPCRVFHKGNEVHFCDDIFADRDISDALWQKGIDLAWEKFGHMFDFAKPKASDWHGVELTELRKMGQEDFYYYAVSEVHKIGMEANQSKTREEYTCVKI